jgi:hypothetical protein
MTSWHHDEEREGFDETTESNGPSRFLTNFQLKLTPTRFELWAPSKLTMPSASRAKICQNRTDGRVSGSVNTWDLTSSLPHLRMLDWIAQRSAVPSLPNYRHEVTDWAALLRHYPFHHWLHSTSPHISALPQLSAPAEHDYGHTNELWSLFLRRLPSRNANRPKLVGELRRRNFLLGQLTIGMQASDGNKERLATHACIPPATLGM